MQRTKSRLFIILLLSMIILISGLQFFKQEKNDSPTDIKSKKFYQSVLLIDVNTKEEIYSENSEKTISPASLTKLLTAYIVFEALEKGELELEKREPVPKAAWASQQPKGSSVMNLGSEQLVSVDELLQGLLVASGNDAAIALALRVSGSIEQFVKRMNLTVKEMGYQKMRFVDPAGIKAANQIEAQEFSRFLLHYLERWPESLSKYHSLPSIFYPRRKNLRPEAQPCGMIVYNTNHLVASYSGCDGLKTGHISEAGYHLVVTAQRGDRRLLAIVLGVRAQTSAQAIRLREEKARELLDMGFDT